MNELCWSISILHSCLSLYWTTWQVYMADCLYQYTFYCHSGSQKKGDKDTASPQSQSETQQEVRGIWKVFSRGENNVQRNKNCPLLYFLASIPPWCRQDMDRQSWYSAIGNSVRLWCLGFRISLYTKFPLTQLEVIAIASSPITTGKRSRFSVFHRRLLCSLTIKLILHVHNFLAIAKYC